MKLLSWIIFAVYFLQSVSGAGYQGCLERVHLFQAYEIDGLLDAPDQIMGFKCLDWDDRTTPQTCRGDYAACTGSRPGGRYNFDELMDSMRSAREKSRWAAGRYQSDGRIDVQQTATQCYERYRDRIVPNFPAFKAMKGNVYEFNDYLRKMGKQVDRVYRDHRGDHADLFKNFDETRDAINKARAGDHGPYLINTARASDIVKATIYTQDLGRNPATGEAWETVDWAKTVNEAKSHGDDGVRGRVREFLNSFYRGSGAASKSARQHLVVFRSYKYMKNKAVKCGGRRRQPV